MSNEQIVKEYGRAKSRKRYQSVALCSLLIALYYLVSDNEQAPLVYKRSRQDGVSGDPFQTAPIVKYLNTRRVLDADKDQPL
jgi:hypothetical protein